MAMGISVKWMASLMSNRSRLSEVILDFSAPSAWNVNFLPGNPRVLNRFSAVSTYPTPGSETWTCLNFRARCSEATPAPAPVSWATSQEEEWEAW